MQFHCIPRAARHCEWNHISPAEDIGTLTFSEVQFELLMLDRYEADQITFSWQILG